MSDIDLTELDELADQPHRHAANTGCVQRLIEHNPDREETIRAAVDHPAPGMAVGRWLTGHGLFIAGQTVNRHRRGDCECRI